MRLPTWPIGWIAAGFAAIGVGAVLRHTVLGPPIVGTGLFWIGVGAGGEIGWHRGHIDGVVRALSEPPPPPRWPGLDGPWGRVDLPAVDYPTFDDFDFDDEEDEPWK